MEDALVYQLIDKKSFQSFQLHHRVFIIRWNQFCYFWTSAQTFQDVKKTRTNRWKSWSNNCTKHCWNCANFKREWIAHWRHRKMATFRDLHRFLFDIQDIFILFSDVCAYRLHSILLHMCNDSKDVIIMLIWSHMGGHDNPVSVLR